MVSCKQTCALKLRHTYTYTHISTHIHWQWRNEIFIRKCLSETVKRRIKLMIMVTIIRPGTRGEPRGISPTPTLNPLPPLHITPNCPPLKTSLYRIHTISWRKIWHNMTMSKKYFLLFSGTYHLRCNDEQKRSSDLFGNTPSSSPHWRFPSHWKFFPSTSITLAVTALTIRFEVDQDYNVTLGLCSELGPTVKFCFLWIVQFGSCDW